MSSRFFSRPTSTKPPCAGAYRVDSVVLPDGLTRRTYTRLLGQANAPVARLVVVQRGPEPQALAATIMQYNPLFSAKKQLKIELADGEIRHYEVVGTQKLILFDTLRYSAAGQVEP